MWLVGGAVAAGAAFGGVRAGMNGTVKRVERIERRGERTEDAVSQIAVDVALIKGQLSRATHNA